MKLRRVRWVGHVACMGKGRGVYWVLLGKPQRERDCLEDPEVDWRIVLRWIFRKWGNGLAEDRDRWQARVNAVMILPVSKNGGIS
jgi:hypothetical protein